MFKKVAGKTIKVKDMERCFGLMEAEIKEDGLRNSFRVHISTKNINNLK